MDRPFNSILTRAISCTSQAAATNFSLDSNQSAKAKQAAIYNPSTTLDLFAQFGSSTDAASVPTAGNAVAGLVHVPPASQVLVSLPSTFTYGSMILSGAATVTAYVMLGRTDN
jgi:hypothetical protein